MTDYVLRLFTDRFESKAALDHALPAANRAIYVVDGMATVSTDGAAATLSANSGWFASGEITARAGAEGAHLLRYELIKMPQPDHGIAMGDGVRSEITLDAKLNLEDPDGYLMRCDKVELPPGGIAYTHTHQGGGIRCLLVGGFNVEVEGHKTVVAPGEAWFEAGPDPVYAYAPDDKPGHFSRVMILPRRLKGQSSIRYVNPEDADKPKLQTYTIFVDEFIDI